MRFRLTVLAAMAGALFVIGCNESTLPDIPTSAAPAPDEVTAAVSNAASSETTVFTIPGSILSDDPSVMAAIQACLGEPVTFVGTDLIVVHRTLLPDGSRLFVLHGNPQGTFALGTTSGTMYRLAASDTLAHVIAPAGTVVHTYTANLWVIGRGGGPTFGGPILLHVTVTPAGDVTAEIDFVENGFQCR